MKLITHNMLTSKIIKNVVNGYPLKLVATKTEVKEADYQPDFINRILKSVDYKALYEAANSIGYSEGLPKSDTLSDEALSNEEILKKLHQVLLEVEVIEGDLICPETGRKFPIRNGIPDMLINDDEI